MPSGALAKRLLFASGLGLVVLLVVGFAYGAVGSAILGTDKLLDEPEIHLAPQPVFPASVRDEHLGLTEPLEHGEKPHASPLSPTKFAVTNTLLSAWLTTAVIVVFFVLAARKSSLIPGRLQGFVEALFEGMLGFCSTVLGPEMARRAFPIVTTIFLFVLFNAWMALLPFYQFIGVIYDGHLKAHLLKSAGTDLNMPLALALVSFAFVEYWGLRTHGMGYFKKFFAFGNLLRGRPSGLINVFVGLLEGISELVRTVSFTFRLFGNMTAGEILVVMITFLVPFVATQFVFGLELLVGLIQAVIFASLTVVFLSVAVSHEQH